MKKFLVVAVGTVLFTTTAQAATFVESREVLMANDSVDWSVLGSAFTTVANPINVTSSSGLSLRASVPTGSFIRLDQTPFFPGAFNVGESLLFTGLANPGPVTITFDTPVFGVGTQIQSDPIEIFDYTSTIEAFDSFGNSLGSFEQASVSRPVAGSGVIFTGVFDRDGDIKKVVLNALERDANVPFAFNALSLRTIPKAVVEPSLMLGVLLFGVWGTRKQLFRSLKNM